MTGSNDVKFDQEWAITDSQQKRRTLRTTLFMHSAILFSNSYRRPSVCPSARHTPVLYLNDCRYRQTFSSAWEGM